MNKKLTVNQVIEIHKNILAKSGGSSGIRDINLVESAIESPFATMFGDDLYPTVKDKAAQLCFSLVKNHAFVDGNKRTAVGSLIVFLELNNIELTASNNEIENMVLGLANNSIGKDDLLDWIILTYCFYRHYYLHLYMTLNCSQK